MSGIDSVKMDKVKKKLEKRARRARGIVRDEIVDSLYDLNDDELLEICALLSHDYVDGIPCYSTNNLLRRVITNSNQVSKLAFAKERLKEL